MERHFDVDLEKFKTDLLKMATLTEDAIYRAIDALKKKDKALAEKVIVADQAIDELENEIEQQAIELLALHQPLAIDLRFITTGMRINTELERIADLVVNICQRVIDIAGKAELKPIAEIPQLAENANKMVKKAIDAFVKRNDTLARQVIESDKKSNQLRNSIMEELINNFLIKDGKTAPRAIPLLLMARDLERISDHAASIAEDVIYMIDAENIKHQPR